MGRWEDHYEVGYKRKFEEKKGSMTRAMEGRGSYAGFYIDSYFLPRIDKTMGPGVKISS